MSWKPGNRLGPYEVTGAIGSGGMGEVYRARDTRLYRDVAIKVLPDSFSADAERRARFEREAQAIAALSHPNVIAVFDIGTHDDQIYVVTELLEGETLRQRLVGAAHPLPIRKAVEIAVQVARGLAAAHDKHVIHRDLKPENIFLLDDGRVKILDFGLARQMPSQAGASETIAAATGEGIVMGTVGYMAPEQVRGQSIDARADVFAFGCVLYEMLTGQRAFRRGTPAETMTAILHDDAPEPTQLRADLPPSLDRIVRHCLEKSPNERFETARDLAFALEALSGPEGPSGSVSSRVPAAAAAAATRSRWPLALMATAAVLIGLGAWYVLTQSRSPEPTVAAAAITLGAATQLTSDDGLEIDPAISPDGRTVAYAAGTARRRRIYIRPVIGGRTIPLSEGKNAIEYQPRWSPDGSQILYLTPDGAFVASAYGGAASAIAASDPAIPLGGAITAAAWSPDGRQILLARGTALSVMTRDDRRERTIGTTKELLYSCDWAPRGDLVACACGNQQSVVPGPTFANVAPSTIVVARSTAGPLTEIAGLTGLNQNPVWSADGQQLYFVSNRHGTRDIYVADIGPQGAAVGEPRRVTTGLGAQAFSFSAQRDRLVYVSYTSRANIWSLPIPVSGTVDTSAARPVTSTNQNVESMRVSSDKQWLLFDSTLYVNSELFRIPVGGGTQLRITEDSADDFAPNLSSNGRDVAYHSWRRGSRDIFIIPVEGGTPQAVTTAPGHESYPVWSPDGQAIAYFDQTFENGATRGLFLIRRDAAGQWGPPQSLRAATGAIGVWLPPDGQALAVPHSSALEVIPVNGGAARVVYAPAPGSADPAVEGVAVSDDGRTLYFKSHDRDGRASIWRVPIDGGRPQLVVRFSDPTRESSRADFAVGAGRFFFTLEDRQSDIWVAEVGKK